MTNNSLKQSPDIHGYYGHYGGSHVPPELQSVLDEVAVAYREAQRDPSFQTEYATLLRDYVGRPSPLYYAQRLTEYCGGAKIYLKREDLNHTGAHKINHCLGEALLAKRMGKKKLLAETGAGQHGVAVVTAAALVGLEAEIHMGTIDIAKQQPNVRRMEILGATLVPVEHGGRSLKDAVDSAFMEFVRHHDDTFFAIGSVVGPHPYPMMIRDFQSIVGREAKAQMIEREGRLPDCLIACVGGGSNAIGLFHEFLDDDVAMVGVEPSGRGTRLGEHAATLTHGTPGTIHGMFTYLLQDASGDPAPVHSIASGLDYPGVGPAHSQYKDTGRVEYVTASDREAVDAFRLVSRLEGIIPALESSHALVEVFKRAPRVGSGKNIIVNLSGRGDKDLDYVADYLKK